MFWIITVCPFHFILVCQIPLLILFLVNNNRSLLLLERNYVSTSFGSLQFLDTINISFNTEQVNAWWPVNMNEYLEEVNDLCLVFYSNSFTLKFSLEAGLMLVLKKSYQNWDYLMNKLMKLWCLESRRWIHLYLTYELLYIYGM